MFKTSYDYHGEYLKICCSEEKEIEYFLNINYNDEKDGLYLSTEFCLDGRTGKYVVKKIKIPVSSISPMPDNKGVVIYVNNTGFIPSNVDNIKKYDEVSKAFSSINNFQDFYAFEAKYCWEAGRLSKGYNVNTDLILIKGVNKKRLLKFNYKNFLPTDLEYQDSKLPFVPLNLIETIANDLTLYNCEAPLSSVWWFIRKFKDCDNLENKEEVMNILKKLTVKEMYKLLEDYPFFESLY